MMNDEESRRNETSLVAWWQSHPQRECSFRIQAIGTAQRLDIGVAGPDHEHDPEPKIEEEEDELDTCRTKTSKQSKFQSVAPKAVTDIFQLDSDESETGDEDAMDHAADIAYMQEQPADRVGAPINEPLAHQEGDQIEDSGKEFQTLTYRRLADVEDDHVEEPDPKRACYSLCIERL
ncbi:hypothetical protein FAUST_7688 [Fusarium austroamericanum]|uniref:Uncharacterized protein n=1 Tax=Fusarium austroamericanum TaxID=282268 RepID=A0AAN5Z640_FUSAU|nr:hypothetical protein FAUST_7688 [Fusarium austroamericanum]